MTNKDFFHRLLITILTIGVVVLVIYSFRILLMVFASCLLAVLLIGLSDLLRRKIPLPESLSLIFVLLFILSIFSGISYLFGQGITAHFDKFTESLFNAYQFFIGQMRSSTVGSKILLRATSGVNNTTGFRILSKITDVFSTTVGSLFDIFVILFLGLFLSFEHEMYIKGIIKLFPDKYHDKVVDVLSKTGSVLRWWMIGQFLYMLSIGLFATLGLEILGMPMALSLGLFAMLLSFIPYLGTIFSAIPALLIAMTVSNNMLLYVLLLYVVIHLITSYLVAPLIQLEAISLPPALTIVAQILMAYWIGGIGLLVATPLIAVVIVFVESLYISDVLGREFTILNKHRRKQYIPKE